MKKITTLCMLLLVSMFSSAQFFEDFEGASFPPAGWLVADNGVGTLNSWTRTNQANQVYQGTWSAFMTRENIGAGNTAQDWLITPQILVPTNGQLKFFARTTLAGNQGTVYQVRVSTNANQAAQGNYALVQQFSENELSSIYDVYEEKVINLTAFVGQQVYIAFVMQFTQPTAIINGDRWLLDNVLVAQQCFDPTALTATNITQTTAQLQWGNPSGATEWEIEIVPQPGNPTGSGVVVNTNPYVATGLQPATQYQYYVRARCQPNNFSNWAGPFSFQTAIPGNNCASAIQIPSLPYSTLGTTQGLSSSVTGTPGTAASCGTSGAYLAGPDIFYTFTAPSNGPVNVQMTPNGNHSGIFIYNSCANVGVSCVAGQANTNSNIRNFNFNAVAGQTYIVVISTSASAPNVSYNLVIQQPGCTPPPTNLTATNIGQTSATLGWQINGSAAAWEIAVQNAGDTVPLGTGTPVTTNSFLATQLLDGTPLQASSNYQFWVRTNCGGGSYSIWAGPFLFSTAICDVANQCNYTFRMTSTSGGWNGARMQIIQNGVIVTTLGATFNSGTQLDVTVPLCNNIPVEVFWNIAGNFPNNVGLSIINPSPFNQTIFTKPPGSGFPLTTIYNAMVDCNNPVCLPPSALATSNITINSATLSWTSNGFETQWEVLVLPNNAPTPGAGATGTITSNNPYQINGLNPATIYNVYVRAVCGNGVSAWSQVHVFNTLVCNTVDQCVYSFVLTDTGNNGWQGNTITVTQNNILIATLGPTFTSGGGPVTIPVSLCPGVPFEVFWNAGGTNPEQIGLVINDPFNEDIYTKLPGQGNQNSLLFSGIGNCTPPTCPKPQNQAVTNITINSAQLSWTEVGTATQWEVYVVQQGGPAPNPALNITSGILTSNNPYTATGLNSGAIYQFYVRSVCNATTNDLSAWKGPFQFITLISNDECATAINVPVNTTLFCTQTVAGTVIGATASTQPITPCTGTANNDVWYSFTATSTRHTISLINIQGSTTNLNHAVYSGTCGALTNLFCSDPNDSFFQNYVVGQTYYIRVYSASNAAETTTFNICIGTPGPPITGDVTTYTVPQLVEDVFLNSNCATISNIQWRTGTGLNTPLTNQSGIGYFNTPGASFPFTEGIVLSTGFATSIQGPNNSILSNTVTNWTDDPQLTTYLNSVITPSTYQNATWVQFDFVPLASQFTFDFLFASEEYGTFQCSFSDAFAFFVTQLDANGNPTTWQNLALVPGTTDPISVVTIRDQLYNTGCPSVNPQFFGTFYGANGVNPNAAPINFNGVTVPMQIQANVIPQQNYRIKLVIQDRSDTAYDSAVFLKANSFNVGDIQLGNDLLVSDGTALCPGDSIVLDTELNPAQFSFNWQRNGENFNPAQTGPTLTVTESGIYTVTVQYINTPCTNTADISIEYYNLIDAGTPSNLVVCNASGISTFDLTSNEAAMLAPLTGNYTFSYHLSDDDATFNVNPITNPTAYTNITPTQTIYVRLVRNGEPCFTVLSFDLVVQDLTPLFDMPATLEICQNSSGTISITAQNYDPTLVAYSWTLDNNPLPDTTSSITVSQAGIYEVTINNSGCTITGSTTVTILTPTIPTFAPVADICPGASLSALPTTSLNGIVGTWSPVLNNQATTTYTFTPDAGQCAATTTLTITVLPNDITPTFNSVADICPGASLSALPTTSLNGIVGTWSPALNNQAT
ncbi:MAG: choice-of-anchor L domain-containing protein, partial [Flavobacterium sp.]